MIDLKRGKWGMLKLLRYYDSILYCLMSLYLGYLLINTHDGIWGVVLLGATFVKIFGMLTGNKQLLTIGIVGMNIIWAVSTYVFITSHVAVNLPYQFPLFILLIGGGIALRGRYSE